MESYEQIAERVADIAVRRLVELYELAKSANVPPDYTDLVMKMVDEKVKQKLHELNIPQHLKDEWWKVFSKDDENAK
jgi:uncharacterized protein YpuA (DUF1002 family)